MTYQFTAKQPNPHFPGVLDIEPQDILDHQDKLKLVDVRQPDEYVGELGHIAGAELIVLNTLPEKLAALPKDQSVVFICRSGGRSAQATAFALQHGFQHVYNMRGGMLLWNELNLPSQR